jgi:hypothetical protein
MRSESATQFPRRDADGRVISMRELLVAALLGTLVGVVVLLVIDGIVALIGVGTFGGGSGWLTAILPALLFFDDLRSWRGHGVRFLVAVVGAGVAIGLGLIGAASVGTAFDGDVPAIVSGTVGAAVASTVYTPVWFHGIRWLTGHDGSTGHSGERGSR